MKNFKKAVFALVLLWTSANAFAQTKVEEFEVKNGAISISGSLYLPEPTTSKVPVLVFIPGSSSETRETFVPFAEAIAARGIAVVVYDKRGTGKSTGTFIKVSAKTSKKMIKARAKDVGAIVAFLKQHSQIDGNKIGFSASSQGTWVAFEVHKRRGDIAFIMNYSGGVASVGESDYYDEIMDDAKMTIEEGNLKTIHFKGVKGYNPYPVIEKTEIPLLFVYGSEDDSHPALFDLSRLKQLNKANIKTYLLQNVNHNLIDVTTQDFSADIMPISLAFMENVMLQN